MYQYKVQIPEGVSGIHKIEKFEVSSSDANFHNMRAMMGGGRCITPGIYTKLVRGKTLVMSDTPAEIQDHLHFIRKARGSVLINGLGIGMCLSAVLNKPVVTDVTVIEISEDVINLVASHIQDDRLTLINESAFDYKPPKGKRYDAVWHDIWDFICSDNLREMTKLHRKYYGKTEWQGSWCKKECKRGY